MIEHLVTMWAVTFLLLLVATPWAISQIPEEHVHLTPWRNFLFALAIVFWPVGIPIAMLIALRELRR